MKRLFLENKSGFVAYAPFVIFEPNGNIFYSSEFTDKIENKEKLIFNLPAGKFYLEGSLTKLDKPKKFKDISLPPHERNIKRNRYRIIFGNNPNKCTIHYKAGIIVFDNAFKDAPLYIKYDIYFHELGHHFYKTEKYADLYAVKKMLDYGFNPSQIGRVKIFSLGSTSLERKKYIINKLK